MHCQRIEYRLLILAGKEGKERPNDDMGAGCHTLRHSYALLFSETGYDIRTVQELLSRTEARTAMIDTHVLNRGGRGVRVQPAG